MTSRLIDYFAIVGTKPQELDLLAPSEDSVVLVSSSSGSVKQKKKNSTASATSTQHHDPSESSTKSDAAANQGSSKLEQESNMEHDDRKQLSQNDSAAQQEAKVTIQTGQQQIGVSTQKNKTAANTPSITQTPPSPGSSSANNNKNNNAVADNMEITVTTSTPSKPQDVTLSRVSSPQTPQTPTHTNEDDSIIADTFTNTSTEPSSSLPLPSATLHGLDSEISDGGSSAPTSVSNANLHHANAATTSITTATTNTQSNHAANNAATSNIHNNSPPPSIETLCFRPSVLDRYPQEDHKDYPLSTQIASFCLPDCVTITTQCEMPKFFTFVMTDSDASRVYCSALCFYEYFNHKDTLEEICNQLDSERNSHNNNSCSTDMMDEASNHLSSSAPPHQYTTSDNSLELDQLKDPPSYYAGIPNDHIRQQLKKTLYISKAIVLVSHYPLFSTFKKFLTQLYRIHLTPSSIPIERWICNFCSEVPLPPRGRTQVQYNLSGTEHLFLSRPPPNQLPLLDVPIHHVFLSLDLTTIVTIFNFILAEQKIIFHSTHYSLLGTACEFFISTIYPFEWTHTYIPLLPRYCLPFLEAPIPYIVGIHSSLKHSSCIPTDALLVDLDHNRISTGNQNLKIHKLPERQHRKLVDMLQKLRIQETIPVHSLEHIDSAFNMAPTPEMCDSNAGGQAEFPVTKIRMAFFRFFVSLFQKYRSYMVKVKLDSNAEEQLNDYYGPLFKKEQFVRDQSPQDRPFVRMILDTQAFDQFLKQRIVDSSSNTPSSEVIFFDESIQAKLNRSKLKFHKKETPFLNDHSLDIQKTSVALTPLCSDLPLERVYHHETFPQPLNASLFYKPRDIEILVKAEDISSKNTVLVSWKPIIKQLNILQQQLGKQQRSKAQTNFNEAIKNSKNTLRRDHTRSVSFGNMDFAQFESNLSESSGGAEKNHSQTLSFAGAPVLLSSVSLPGRSISSTEKTRHIFECVKFKVKEVCPNPECSHVLTNLQIRMGWTSNDVQDYRTTCPQCSTKFVPRFSVIFDGSAIDLPKKHFELRHEYLSPALVRKEVENLVKNGVRTDAKLLVRHSRIFWNLIVHFRDLSIPLNFLLPFLDWEEVAQQLEDMIRASDESS